MTGGILGSVRAVNVQGQISVQSQMEAIVFIFLQIYFATRGMFKNWLFPSFSWGTFNTGRV